MISVIVRSRNISGVSGGTTLVDGDPFTVSGSGFGTNVSASNQAWLGGVNGFIETSAANGRISSGALSTLTLPSGWSAIGEGPEIISDLRAYGGTKSLLNRAGYSAQTGGTYDSELYQYGVNYDFGEAFLSLYFSTVWYLENNGNTSGQVKFERIVGAAGGGLTDNDFPNVLFNMFGSSGSAQRRSLGGDASNDILPNLSYDSGWVFDGWIRREVFFVPGTSGTSDGSLQYRFTRLSDGTVLDSGSFTGQLFWGDADPAFRYLVLQGYLGNGMHTDGAQLYLGRDSFAIANPSSAAFPKHVLLLDAATYAASNKALGSFCQFSEWGDTSITIAVNQGAHSNLTGKYLYVMEGIDDPINTEGIALA